MIGKGGASMEENRKLEELLSKIEESDCDETGNLYDDIPVDVRI